VNIRQLKGWAVAKRGFGLALVLVLALGTVSPQAIAKPKPRSSVNGVAAAIVVDMNTGRILYSQAADAPRRPASLTKMMTLYMLFSYLRAGTISYDSELTVTPHAASQSPTKLNLKPGATITTAEAISALVTLSANDAAVTIAENMAGTEENFARMMTEKARALGMSGTTFRNASGLPNDEQVTTARDMAILAQHLIRDFPENYACFGTKYFSYQGRRYRNHNHLLFDYRGTDGIKTGYTREAGFNLTASVRRDDKHLVAVVLGGKTNAGRDAAMRALLDQTFPQAVAAKSSAPPLGVSKQAAQPMVTALEAPAPAPPAPKQQVYALANAGGSIEPASFGGKTSGLTSPTAATSRAAVPASPPAAEPAKVSASGSQPSSADKPGKSAGAFHVQVGAFTSKEEAESRLGEVKERAATLLDGHPQLAIAFQKDDTQWYRARFADFSEGSARSACAELKRLSLDCVVMRAN
jgi:D-alanyl-D-alanine carboxypeptidase